MHIFADRMRWRVTRFSIGVLLSLCMGPALAADGVLKRKNIDNLTTQELAAFEHAIQIMKDRSAKNQYDKSGYLWQAWVHNCPSKWVPKNGKEDGRKPVCDFWERERPDDPSKYELAHPGMCEHGKDLFLPWHRAQFYYFERILQGTDPDGTIADSRGKTGPSTKNVTVPYWNWTRPPTGGRYPAAYENLTSPLFHKNRASDPIAPGSAFPFATSFLLGYMVHFQDWPTFGGFAKGTKGGFGSFEAVVHNPMHSTYMAGDMGDPGTAALDPVFFAFHAFIDLLYENWLAVHGKDNVSSQNFFLRGEQPTDISNPPGFTPGAGKPSMGQVKLYFDTKALGYEYEVASEDRLPNRAELTKILGLEDSQDPPVFGTATRSLFTRLLERSRIQPNSAPNFIRTFDVTIPAATAISLKQQFFATFERNQHEADLSYQMDVYLYPKSAPFDAASLPFRSRYLATLGAHWGTGALHIHDEVSPARLNISPAMLELIKGGRSGEVWSMSIAITVLPSLTTFGEPSLGADPALQ